ncbi:DMT family transporter [Pseudoduganella sp. RAF19]|uniref:DMT family transporter n=1 Tax=Pseudoduganella sp. RAF19 TaxID=3233052 RepID=UPI003F9C7178
MQSLWMLVASFMFAAMGVCVKLASDDFSTSEIVMYRGIVGTVVLFCTIRIRGLSLKTTMPWDHLWRGFIGVISLWLWFYAIGKLPLATAITLNYMAPIWIAVWLFGHGWWHRKNHVEWPLIAAVLMSFVGVALLLRPAFASNQMGPAMVALISSVLSAMAYLQVRKLGLAGEPEYRVVFYFSVMNLLAGAGGHIVESGLHFTRPNSYTIWLLLGLGLLGMGAQIAMTRAYRLGKTLVVANLQYTGIVFSSIWGVIVFNDTFDWHSWAGIAIILASGIAATFYNTRSTERGKAIAETDPIASEA